MGLCWGITLIFRIQVTPQTDLIESIKSTVYNHKIVQIQTNIKNYNRKDDIHWTILCQNDSCYLVTWYIELLGVSMRIESTTSIATGQQSWISLSSFNC